MDLYFSLVLARVHNHYHEVHKLSVYVHKARTEISLMVQTCFMMANNSLNSEVHSPSGSTRPSNIKW